MKKIIIGLTGQMSCGKGTVAEYLEKKYGASTYRFSSMLRDVLNRLYLEITRHNMQTLSTLIRKNFSEDLMARVMAKDVKSDNNNLIVIEGIRRMADIKYLQELENFKLISIEADSKVRYERLTKRTENKGDTEKTYKEFMDDHKTEAESEIPKTMEHADIIINNNGDLKKLYKQIDDLINT
ncbi:hypothetical protein A2331_02380 [Candidatus Falkowbacteria bacterium RIFOXYB2_FULL_34_18]|uniref:Dephospho-CoA kinase n=1 Tax=Candidatus Falkowbacteria bacterium RIFOXYD2_FULL_34_120 TaxID=1798007 RepID=A0A1F5TSE1_9BACT|nr:MAG: hypothetical protein A2331_02380 [Candidatus Falkowbacteria bacterium RIFOXYB2_FULL_34_18]OGF29692.1 MAG: hypothetical protein A2500_00245 [Candidatus Falkowbacteria bacterium RIFOXYC12_FULL_34_55]OGF37443.1 MAG: hypothetical protein A2466_00475 [Candidatus Falkowbacteria bacterium RIFOXYC2_FULL_34_220]OGF39168.1 MAG: hypothetical protein A2515_00430 [Candidatus Falkowbacteria bacterium RIFOXYD12_FULL_34_57]OGF41717.1 MAG: hypothetical protein A2531_06150 [Candidatus Falkowbacteria bact